ncbi:MAG: hypothetical protein ABIJ83_04220 [Patescibacteria group bacterium]|nr:hypothetical protein [Patescibacteria group bacterium]MBU0880209.1 hypothetical protein [Patescibacteria group bacterium]MBU1783662.1 hypothetical protein [Patescibacteria group bacterium]MBU2081092.1 hypothetical protein [Patescibacteria group bacterium]MBU2214356.1 hypothetical protein [Patescibacteria group bacterium]
MMFSKKIISSLFFGVFGLLLFLPASFAQAGPIGTSAACTGAATRGANFCFDRTNIAEELKTINPTTKDAYNDTAGLLTIVASHDFGAKKVEFHLCQVLINGNVAGPGVGRITADGLSGKIVINTKDGVYNGSMLCATKDNYLKTSGKIQASGHDGWIEINTYNFEMKIAEDSAGIGSVITNGTTGYNSLDGSNKENTKGLGGENYDCNTRSWIKGGKNGGSGGSGGGGGGGTIKLNITSDLDVKGTISAIGGDSVVIRNCCCGAGGGSGGVIEIKSEGSIFIPDKLIISASGGSGSTYNGRSGSNGVITLNAGASLNNNGSISSGVMTLNAGASLNNNGFIIGQTVEIFSLATSTISTTGSVSGDQINLQGFVFDISGLIIGNDSVKIFSSATSTLSTAGSISGANSVKLQGFAFDINGNLNASAVNGKIDVSATSSLNILNATKTLSTGAGGSITLNSTSTAVTISRPISAPSGSIVIKSGTDFSGSGTTAIAITGAEISIFSGGALAIPAILNLNATNGTGKIILQSCKKIKIQGNLNSSISNTVGSIIIFANDLETTSGSSIKSIKNLQIFYSNSCSGFEASPGLCQPLNFTAGALLPSPPSIIKVIGTTTCNLGKINTPPYVPKESAAGGITNGATGIDRCPTLKWNAGDIEGNNLTFSIYFSSALSSVTNESASAKIGEFTTTSTSAGGDYTYSLITSTATPSVCPLDFEKNYYWKVKAIDNP